MKPLILGPLSHNEVQALRKHFQTPQSERFGLPEHVVLAPQAAEPFQRRGFDAVDCCVGAAIVVFVALVVVLVG